MKIQLFDFAIDVTKALLWRHNQAVNLQALINNKQAALDELNQDFWTDWVADVFNLTTANDFGLSVWAIILNVPLSIDPAPPKIDNFGFGEFNINFNNSNFNSSISPIILSTDQARIVLKLRYYQLMTRCTVPECNKIVTDVFGELGNVYVSDNLDMTITYNFDFVPASKITEIIEKYDLLPRPSGVERFIVTPEVTLITITEQDAASWADIIVPIEIDLSNATGLEADFSNFRVTDDGGATEIDWWAEPFRDLDDSVIWVKVSLSASESIDVQFQYGVGVSPTKGLITDVATDSATEAADWSGGILSDVTDGVEIILGSGIESYSLTPADITGHRIITRLRCSTLPDTFNYATFIGGWNGSVTSTVLWDFNSQTFWATRDNGGSDYNPINNVPVPAVGEWFTSEIHWKSFDERTARINRAIVDTHPAGAWLTPNTEAYLRCFVITNTLTLSMLAKFKAADTDPVVMIG